MEKTTALYQNHLENGGKMVEFAGYLMPVQYGAGVVAEHMAVRQKAGLFDVSHMGEVMLRGPGALDTLQNLLANDMAGMPIGGCRYSPMCNLRGGVVDDLIVYRLGEEAYMLVVNASNREKDVAWMRGFLATGTELEDASDEVAELAIQGPLAGEILAGITKNGADSLPDKYYTFKNEVEVAGVKCLVSRTGYTGEDGFELYCGMQYAPPLWEALLAAGEANGLVPCGLGARDTLRLEAGMPLYGHEMDEDTTPLAAGLGIFVKRDNPAFNGRQAMLDSPPACRRTGLRVTGRGIARQGARVLLDGREIGVVTSGTQLPYVGWPGAMALMDVDSREPGTKVEVDIRGRLVEAEVVKLPFYRRETR